MQSLQFGPNQDNRSPILLMQGGYGWIGLAIYILLWDRYAGETLSRAFWNSLEHPVKRWPTLIAWGWVTSHLVLKRPTKLLVRW